MNEQDGEAGAPVWRKALASGTGDCVEVTVCGGRVLLRNSKAPQAGQAAFTASEWRAFLAGVKNDEFELVDGPGPMALRPRLEPHP